MGERVKLKWNRKRLGLTQKQFADKVGLSVGTINRLELDDTAWLTVRAETVDRIHSAYDSMASWQPDNAHEVIRDIKEEIESEDKAVEEEEMTTMYDEKKKPEVIDNDGRTLEDEKTLALIEFVYENLKESVDHLEFLVNMKMLKKIVSKY